MNMEYNLVNEKYFKSSYLNIWKQPTKISVISYFEYTTTTVQTTLSFALLEKEDKHKVINM